ncbi:MAG: hypothetical protein HKN35_08995 [Woeseia sp.]|nr:hypothetical protein [Woeseia sp.]NNE61018.1 hypothetical protein [Woeseia sp.]NNL53620.1 hypothetical protein [Woeseia sp.]
MHSDVLTVAHLPAEELQALAAAYHLEIVFVDDHQPIPGSFWGEPEAGIIGSTIYVRGDTPLHSLLHELSHVVCMDTQRRATLHKNAGADDAEESAVCYLQVVLADELAGVGRQRLMSDMDAWGYSFRLGSAARWFAEDATDARSWLDCHALLTDAGRPSFQLRER